MRRFLVFLAPWFALLAILGTAQPSSSAPPQHRAADPNVCANTFLKADIAAGGGAGVYCLGGQRYGSLLQLPGVSFTRASPKTCQTSTGAVIQVASGVPCITDRGMLVEGSATNLLLHSQEFDNAVYDKGTGGSITANAVAAPDGTLTADAYAWPSGSRSFGNLSQTVAGDASAPLAFSIWMRVASGTQHMTLEVSDVATRTVSTAITVTTAWQRFTFLVASSALTNTGNLGVALAGGGSPPLAGDIIYVWQAQLVAGATSITSDIPTTSVPVTRSADSLTLTYSGSPSGATVLYGVNNTTSPSVTSPLDLGSSSGGPWLGNYIRKVAVQ